MSPNAQHRTESADFSDRPSLDLTQLAPGNLVGGKYRIESVLAEGGMGVVCIAQHEVLGQPVVIKFVRPDLEAREEAAERLVVEARLAAKVKSKHVCQVHDAGLTQEGLPYLVMEHLHGLNLAEVLEATGPLAPEVAAAWMLEACEGLREVHAAGIVHRDVKPENLFIAETSDGQVLKVIDFGISKYLHAARDKGLTNPGQSLGSPWYMAPEQMRSPDLVDARADVWSLGAVLFELITGRPPFEGETLPQVCANVLCEPAPKVSHAGVAIDAELERIIAGCLQKDPERRTADVGELQSQLEAWLAAGTDQSGSGVHHLIVVPEPDERARPSSSGPLPRFPSSPDPIPSPSLTPSPSLSLTPSPSLTPSTPPPRETLEPVHSLAEAVDDVRAERQRSGPVSGWHLSSLAVVALLAVTLVALVLWPPARQGASTAARPYVAGWLLPGPLDDGAPRVELKRDALDVHARGIEPNGALAEQEIERKDQQSVGAGWMFSPAQIEARQQRYQRYLESRGWKPAGSTPNPWGI